MNLLLLGLLSAVSAFAQKITVEFDQAADFTRYKTFAIRGGQLNSPNPALNSELVGKQIEADITSNLAAKGLSKVTGASDLNVRYTLGTRRNFETQAYPAGCVPELSGCHMRKARSSLISGIRPRGRWSGALSPPMKREMPPSWRASSTTWSGSRSKNIRPRRNS